MCDSVVSSSPVWHLMLSQWPHWGGSIHGYLSCGEPAHRPPPPAPPPSSTQLSMQLQGDVCPPRSSGRLHSLQGGWRTQMTSSQDLTMRRRTEKMMRMKISSMIRRWRSCSSSRLLQASGRVSTGCSSSTLTWSGAAGSSTWPQVTDQVQVWVCEACWEICVSLMFYCFLCSRADDGWGCGARKHSGQLEGGGQDHHVHQDTREEEDLWQRELPGSHRSNSLGVHFCPESVRMWLICAFLSSSSLEKIRQTAGITAVFVNVERLSPLSEVSLAKKTKKKQRFWLLTESFHALMVNCHPCRGSWRKPGGLKSLTDTQWSCTSSAATPGLKRPSYRSLWQRSLC